MGPPQATQPAEVFVSRKATCLFRFLLG